MNPEASNQFYVTGGTLRADAPCYVERQADRDLLAWLVAGEFCYVLTSRQMGKSSLMVRTARKLREQGMRVAVLDLTALGQNLTAEQWYDGLAIRLGTQLGLEDEVENFWLNNLRLGPCQRWFATIRECVLAQPDGSNAVDQPWRLIVFIDEVDAVRSLPFPTDEFFAAVRECYQRRVEDRAWTRIGFCLLGVAEPHELIKDTNRTPFNIGHRIALADFSLTEALPLANSPGLSSTNGLELDPHKLLARIMYWTHGHPYLTQRLLQGLSASIHKGDAGKAEALIDTVCQDLLLGARAAELDDNIVFVRERLLRTELDLASLLEMYERVLQHESVPDDALDPIINQLHLAGLVRADGQKLAVRNRIYEQVFNPHWVTMNKPLAELEHPGGQRIRLKGTCSLGRTETNDIKLADVKVSRRHALIQKEGQDELWLIDLGTPNGTWLNGERICRSTLLRDNDQIEIGPYRLVFHQPKAPRRSPGRQNIIERTVLRTKYNETPPSPPA